MSKTDADTIVLQGTGCRFEALAHAAITPGHLVQLNSDGEVQAHAVSGGNAETAFAVEDDLQGNGIGDAYGVGKLVQYEVLTRGSVVNALIVNGANVAKGNFLVSNGDGTLKVLVAQVDSAADVETIITRQIVGVALAACDMSGSSGVDPSGRCPVRIM